MIVTTQEIVKQNIIPSFHHSIIPSFHHSIIIPIKKIFTMGQQKVSVYGFSHQKQS